MVVEQGGPVEAELAEVQVVQQGDHWVVLLSVSVFFFDAFLKQGGQRFLWS